MKTSHVEQRVFYLTSIYIDFSEAGDSEEGLIIMARATIYVGFTVPQLLRGVSRCFSSHSALVVLRLSASCYCTANG